MPLKPLRRLVPLAAVALGAALLAPLRLPAPAAAAGSRPLPAAIREKLAGESLLRYDNPAEAQEFYRLKRAPLGEKALPVERYLHALDAMRTMAQHSTVERTVLPSRADLAQRGISVATAADSLGAWTPLGPGNVGGRTRALVVDPRSPQTMFAGATAGGVWKSIDGGASWRPVADLLANIAVNALVMDPRNSNVLYAGTGEGYFNSDSVRGAGIFKSTDGGVTWARLASTANPDFYYVNDLVASPRALYAATDSGVFRSTNGGANWLKIYGGLNVLGGCLDLALRTDLPTDVLFASCGTFEQARVARNVGAEASSHWRTVLQDKGMGRTSLAIAPSNQNVIYALATSNAQGNFDQGLHGVFRSTTGGGPGSWNATVRNTSKRKLDTLLLSNPVIANLKECQFGDQDLYFNQGWYDNVIAVDPADPNRVWAGGVDLLRSDDGGKSWGVASYWWATSDEGNAPSYAHADQHTIVFDPRYNGTTNKTMFVGNDGGVFKTADARATTARGPQATCDPLATPFTWTSLNNGYAVTQFYNGTPYPSGTTYFGGSQDNGTVRGHDDAGPNGWQEILGGDGGFVALDPANPDILYAENTGLSIARSTDGGLGWTRVFNGIDFREDFLFITPFAMAPSDAQELWIGGNSLWRTTDGADNWTKASATVPGQRYPIITAVAIDPADGSHVAAGTVEGYIVTNSDALAATGSTEWQSSQPARGYVSWVTIDPTNPQVLYATYSTFGVTHIWKSADGGATWSPLEGTGTGRIPDVPVQVLVVDPNAPSHLYIGTDAGVFSSIDGGAHWLVEHTGFANVPTDSLKISKAADGKYYLFAFTHGRGAWRVALD